MGATTDVIPESTIRVLDHGFVRLDGSMASDLSVVNGARVSFARRKEVMDESDEGLIRFLMRDRHGTPFEHNAFRFHVRCPIFVAREWMRHRIGCLTGDTVVTFVDCNGDTKPRLRKTIDELWRMWTQGEQNGHAQPAERRAEIERLAAEGVSARSIARRLGVARRAVAAQLRGDHEFRDARWRIRRMRLRVLDEETGEFTVGHVGDILDKGVQPVYELALADGSRLTLTENHRLLTTGGWMKMRDAVGLFGDGVSAQMTRECHVMANGVPVHRNYDWMKARRAEGRSVADIAREAGCSYHTVRKWLVRHDLRFAREERHGGRTPWNKGRTGYRTGMVVSDSHREAIRRARSAKRSNFWRGGVSTRRASIARWTREQAPKVHAQYDYTCQRCGRRGGRLHVHHIVPVWLDESLATAIGNLISVCGDCHAAIHRTREAELEQVEAFGHSLGSARDVEIPIRRGYRLAAHPVKVVSVRYVGMRQTFDLSVEGPWHNFVANGMVVHNSYNEFSMRYAKATDDFYVPEPEDVRTQVGKPGAYSFEPVEPEVAETAREELRAVYDAAYAAYERLVELGVARELARCVMPVGAYTEFYWTINARSLMNFVSLRAADSAQREIRRYAEAVEQFFAEKMPVTHAAFVANDRLAP
jgi:thymidylate synthase (FAD)